ncbi:MAG: DEAD/DEAH box helicase [Chitinophagales bacterium]|nr:DEAD/DEAH box helicase [Chitinophagales bacterium]
MKKDLKNNSSNQNTQTPTNLLLFNELCLSKELQNALSDIGYVKATEIQSKAIPIILNGKDVLGCAQTGTGKTAAFILPILQKIQENPKHKGIRTLVLTPTRELAIQIQDNTREYTKYLNVSSLAIFGGVSQNNQVQAIKRGVDILIATPGRLLDLIRQGIVHISKIETLVLDEADHMLDIGFIHDIKKIIALVPNKRQTLFFSATMPKSIRQFAYSILNQAVEIAVTPAATTAETVEQFVYHIEKKEKPNLLIYLLKNESIHSTLVFTMTKHGADKLVKLLNKSGVKSAAIHGNKSQNARQRALEQFKNRTLRVLVATDIAARGIDIEELPYVINFDLPHVPETYVHRIGRTGRAGKGGVAVSFCENEQREDLKNIQKLIGFNVPVVHVDQKKHIIISQPI